MRWRRFLVFLGVAAGFSCLAGCLFDAQGLGLKESSYRLVFTNATVEELHITVQNRVIATKDKPIQVVYQGILNEGERSPAIRLNGEDPNYISYGYTCQGSGAEFPHSQTVHGSVVFLHSNSSTTEYVFTYTGGFQPDVVLYDDDNDFTACEEIAPF